MHFSADDDEMLVQRVKEHAAEYHPEMSDEEIRSMLSESATDE